MEKRTCKFCGGEITDYECRVKSFCSRECFYESMKRRTIVKCDQCGRNKFIRPCENVHKNFFCSPKCRTDWRKGKESPNKGRKFPNQSGEKNCNWKGENVSYVPLHKWVRKLLGDPKFCKSCNKKGEKAGTKKFPRWNIEWANIDHKYRRNLSDYIPLCKRCHWKHDVAIVT